MTGPTPVVVTGVGGGGNGEQLVKALRMAERPYRIIGTDVSSASKGLYEVDAAHLVPPATADDYVDALLRVCRRHGAPVLLPGSEPELRAVSAARKEFEAEGIFVPVNPPEVIDLCMDKVRTCDFLTGHGFHVPRWRAVRSEDDLRGLDFSPAVLKPSVGGGGSVNLFLAQTDEEVATFGRYLLGMYPEFVVQEYVGTPQSEYTVGVLRTMDGTFVNSIALRRDLRSAISTRLRVANRSGRPELGPTLVVSSVFYHGRIEPFPEVTGPCEEMAAALGARGSINVQCRVVDGAVVVFEINPRFSGTTSLRAMVGYNEPDVLIGHHLFGRPVEPRFPYRCATVLRGLCELAVPEIDIPPA